MEGRSARLHLVMPQSPACQLTGNYSWIENLMPLLCLYLWSVFGDAPHISFTQVPYSVFKDACCMCFFP